MHDELLHTHHMSLGLVLAEAKPFPAAFVTDIIQVISHLKGHYVVFHYHLKK